MATRQVNIAFTLEIPLPLPLSLLFPFPLSLALSVSICLSASVCLSVSHTHTPPLQISNSLSTSPANNSRMGPSPTPIALPSRGVGQAILGEVALPLPWTREPAEHVGGVATPKPGGGPAGALLQPGQSQVSQRSDAHGDPCSHGRDTGTFGRPHRLEPTAHPRTARAPGLL